ncbi:DUF3168 domain-containing protein [Gemmobacter nectariphilus]|uniref:DUF3168 domain-containing protein n=1 Tax=Gemmobacter nectariphilus TaxID=220343 RepID=UPI0004173278|nr:DUF3168 domain-containing protein [Gemmobacter nectariphilus]
MPDDPSLALQKSVIATLRADAGVSAVVGVRVYDEPPQNVEFPYVRLGQIDLAPLRMSGTCVDADILFSVEAHSRPASGRVEATRIADAVRAALDDAALTVAGHVCEWCQYTAQSVTRAADGRSYVAVIAFQAALSAA